jgi:hypothetical protein
MRKKTSIKVWQFIALTFFYVLISSIVKAAEMPLIFPIPQQLQTTNNQFLLDETILIITPRNSSEKDIALAHFLVRELSNKYGIAVKVESRSAIPNDRRVVVMGSIDNPLIKKYFIDNKVNLTKNSPGKEGYILEVGTNKIVIGGSDDAGAFYGLQSLRQLIQSRKGMNIQGVKVRDWPAFPFRAIRMYVPGPENMAFLKRFMGDFMALYKYNKIIIELNCMRLDKHPEVNTGWQQFVKYMQYSRSNSTEGIYGEEKNSSHYDAGDGFIIEKEAVRDLVKFAHEHFLEVIPEIPLLTHAYYLLTNHHELAEYPGDQWPDTYCPSNPKIYDLLFDVYEEYLEVIKPKMVHIGHDEWWGAPLGICPLCRNKDYSNLFAGDVKKLHDYFAKKGIKIAMWGDFLLESVRGRGPQQRTSSTGYEYFNPGGLKPSVVKEQIPKDILIFNWFWIDQEKEMELKNFGFKQLYGNFTPNISNWDERIKEIDLAGGAPSSWASTNEFNFGKDILLDFLGCANLVWSSHTIKQIDLPPIVWQLMPSIRASLQTKKNPSEDGNTIEPVDVSSHFNITKDSKVFNINLSSLKSGEVQNGTRKFNLFNSNKSSSNCAIAVGSEGKGKNPLPNKMEGIAINEDVSSLIFLHACALPAGNQKAYFNIPDNFDSPDMLGWYEIVYEDGFKEVVALQYGVNIMEWDPGGKKSLDTLEGETGAPQKAYCYEADPVNCSDDTANIKFFAFEWVNKRFGKVVKEVNLYGSEHFKALQQDYGKVVSAPMESNAILLAGISKVKKREPYKPKSK